MRLLLVAALVLGCMPAGAGARVLLTREAALAQAFGPRAHVEARTVYLAPAQAQAVERAAGAQLATARVVAYCAMAGDTLLGTGYLDTHRVRSQTETVLILVRPDGKVGAVEVLAFNEPDDYLPPPRWLERFEGRGLSKDLRPGLAVPGLAGATLTARAISAAVRRTLALHAALARIPAETR